MKGGIYEGPNGPLHGDGTPVGRPLGIPKRPMPPINYAVACRECNGVTSLFKTIMGSDAIGSERWISFIYNHQYQPSILDRLNYWWGHTLTTQRKRELIMASMLEMQQKMIQLVTETSRLLNNWTLNCMSRTKPKPEIPDPVIRLPRAEDSEYAAVFRERSDGDWDFVMCVSIDITTFPMLSQSVDDQAMAMIETICDAVNGDGDRALIVYHIEPDFPQVYEHDADSGK